MNIQKFTIFHEISAGGIVIIKEKGIFKVLIIHRNQMNDWTFPKGHQKQKESLQETAIREVKEETSISALPLKYLGKFTYKVVDNKRQTIYFCTVHWFEMLPKNKRIRKKKDKEILQVAWQPFNEKTFSLLTYQNDKNILKKVKAILNKKSEF